jgi:hypothetical protein
VGAQDKRLTTQTPNAFSNRRKIAYHSSLLRRNQHCRCKKPGPGFPGPGDETVPSAYCGFTNRPTRPAAPLVWPASLACSSGNVNPGGSSLASRSVAITIYV